jgi:lipoprotein-anchoring transpeptidase ErfK/SrfK
MRTHLKQLVVAGLLALLMTLCLSFSPLFTPTSHAAPAAATWTGVTTGWANVRLGPGTGSGIVTVYAPNQKVTVYATVSGQTVWGGISTWYRISNLSSAPRYIYSALVARTSTSAPANYVPATSSTNWTGVTTGWANVRSGPGTGSGIVTVYAPNQKVTVYATVSGQTVWGGISTWYRISSLNSAPRYIYGGLVTRVATTAPINYAPAGGGKVIVVVLSKQWLYAYEGGRLVNTIAVTTGRPTLATPTGTYSVFSKLSPTWFYSPFPQGSVNWYPPTYINYALGFKAGGFFLHDATWRSVFGPGTNLPHNDPQFGWQTGSHGCVSMSLASARWLYNWAAIGTVVQINP